MLSLEDHALISIVCTVVPYLTVLRISGTIKYKGSKTNIEAGLS